MQLEWLEDFIELARTRSLSRAAENRFVTHPAFGRRIRALEDWCGAPLIRRQQPISLTPEGLLLLETAREVVDRLSECRSLFQGAALQREQPIRIATGRTLASDFFPEWYDSLSARFGEFPVSLITSGAQEAIGRLAAGDADLMLIFSSPLTERLLDPARFETLVIGQDELLPVCVPDGDGQPRYRLEDGAAAVPWLAFAPSLALRGVLARHLSRLPSKLAMRMIYQADSYPAIHQMARRGHGLAWLPRMVVRESLTQGSLVLAGSTGLIATFDICLHRLRGPHDERLEHIWRTLATSAP
ncbi:LysR family transcriptional regulator [Pseudomonas oryzihabitans]|uniref:LysR family transcriptional regulator n=1 Tax=Pseudomonas oryzihabitans TaxID=47885 RepID=UPI001473B0F4|nr:LysR substrate-binding domain-containing protein [Pseudomonas oryzihabitans]MBH3331399.1 LysR family transcriptional regulator [Pseudomonas oryzihabitans]NMZ63716.1 LysR family transcriptional regulator [Pseudomonas oryzihabitans]